MLEKGGLNEESLIKGQRQGKIKGVVKHPGLATGRNCYLLRVWKNKLTEQLPEPRKACNC